MSQRTESVKKLVCIYRRLRDEKAAITARAKEEIEVIQIKLDRIEAALLNEFNRLGVTNMKTEFGTPYRQERTSATVADWDALLGFIRTNDAYEFLERRVSKEAVLAYREEHKDLPPGVNFRSEYVINIRAN